MGRKAGQIRRAAILLGNEKIKVIIQVFFLKMTW
jgi:hypothetical protein